MEKQTSQYGEVFESWFINECFALNSYHNLDYEFSYLRTKDDVEVDLIIERPDKSLALVEAHLDHEIIPRKKRLKDSIFKARSASHGLDGLT